jgi:hypothetical protein
VNVAEGGETPAEVPRRPFPSLHGHEREPAQRPEQDAERAVAEHGERADGERQRNTEREREPDRGPEPPDVGEEGQRDEEDQHQRENVENPLDGDRGQRLGA